MYCHLIFWALFVLLREVISSPRKGTQGCRSHTAGRGSQGSTLLASPGEASPASPPTLSRLHRTSPWNGRSKPPQDDDDDDDANDDDGCPSTYRLMTSHACMDLLTSDILPSCMSSKSSKLNLIWPRAVQAQIQRYIGGHLGAENEVQGNHNNPRNRGEASAHRNTTAADPDSGGSENWRASLMVMDAWEMARRPD